MVREGRVLISSATDPDFGAGYYVTAYEVGAIVSGGFYPSTTINVDAGHGFAIGDRLIVGATTTYYRRVTNTTATSLTLNSSLSPTVGDILVNLGPDLGPSEPTFQYSGAAIYDDPDYTTLRSGSTVTTDANGRYRYYHKGIGIWELVRDSTGTPFTIYTDAAQSEVTGPDSVTDNAVVRWDGTTGETTQNSVVTISDTGAVTGITTLNASGAVTAQAALTVGTTLGVTGTSTLAAVNASGLVAMAAAATVGTTLVVTGNATFSANVIRSVAAAVTASTTHTQAGGTALTKDINNVSVCANADDAVTLPSAVAGMTIVVMNNGAQNLRIWPASGDNLGTGVDTVRAALAAGSNVRFTAYDSTNWEEI